MAKPVATILVIAGSLLAIGTSCDFEPSPDRLQTEAQTAQLAEAHAQIGMPNITNWREKRLAKTIYEQRDQELATYTYTYAEASGKLNKLCDSVGYAIPYGVQYSNPQRPANQLYHDTYTLPQAEPNGLYMPESAEASWILCHNPKSNDIGLVYSEPKLIVSPFPLSTE